MSPVEWVLGGGVIGWAVAQVIVGVVRAIRRREVEAYWQGWHDGKRGRKPPPDKMK